MPSAEGSAPLLSLALPAGATERKISFTNPKGERLVGIFVDTGSSDVVILCHGYMANKNMCQFGPLAAALANAGLSSFRFDHACCWRGESELKGPFLMGNHDDEVADMVAAAAFMRNDHKQNVVALLGHSKGGTNVMQYAALVGDIPKMINLSGRFCVREGTLQRFGPDILEKLAAAGDDGIPRVEADGFKWVMTEKDFRGRTELPMEDYAAQIKKAGKVKMLCLHGRHDTTIPWEESKLCSELSGAELVIVDGDHNYRNSQHAQHMIDAVVKFLK